MKIKELLQKIEDDPVSLSDKIREGTIPFDDVTEIIENHSDVPIIIRISYLSHPDCTLAEFKKWYYQTDGDTSWQSVARDLTLTKSPIFRHLEAITFVLSCKDESPKSFEERYITNNHLFKKLIKNPHINEEFKIIYYILTDDPTYLSQDIKDCFFF